MVAHACNPSTLEAKAGGSPETPENLGIQARKTTSGRDGFHHVGQAGLELLASGNPSTSASRSAGITGGLTMSPMLECSSTILAHCKLDLPGSNDSHVSVPQVAETTGLCYHAWLTSVFLAEMKFPYVTQAGLDLLSSSDPSPCPPKIIRVQSPDGVKRITATKRETAATFLKKVAKEFGFQNNGFSVYINRNKTGEITASSNKSLNLLKIKHGDLLFLFPSSLAGPSSEMETSVPPGFKGFGAPNVVEDEIDQYLSKQDGKIYRSRDPQLCRHGPLGKCVHCVPLEPFDEDYLNHLEPPVKHMSFHAYIRKLTGGADKGKFVALENISCKIKSGCEGHLPWPNGICTKCQPSAITLNRQKYRHVDNIMFENHTVADRFLDFWRKTGNQHFGYLYGRYTEHKDIPLGIRAEVAAIYEPPQIGTQNSLELLEDPKAEVVDEIAAKLGLRKVGWIFTDLVSEDTRKGTVRYSRNKDTYFLSSEECITAGDFQNKHPNMCRLSPDGHFGSKFVTAVATGGPDNQVHFEGYQVSNQCMALVRDECLLPCKDAPELGYAKESSSEQYVPDVFYKVKVW
ncbi:Nuclear protein localization protein 4-like protein [Plecturocebus cupreus]